MAELTSYEEYPRSKFPGELDDWDNMEDLNSTTAPLAEQYNQLFQSGYYQEAADLLNEYPELDAALFNAYKFNQLMDGIKAVEKLFLDDLRDYVISLFNKTIGINDDANLNDEDELRSNAYSAYKVLQLIDDLVATYDPKGGARQVAFYDELQSLINGGITKVGTSTVGSTTQPIYLNGGTPTALSGNVGGTARPIYSNSGVLTALSSTVGSDTQPIYCSSGTLTACGTTVGGAAKPIYSSSGTLTACSSTVGGTATPVYMSSGTITACSSTVGASTTPVYMSSGKITACSAMMPLSGSEFTGIAYAHNNTSYGTSQIRNIAFSSSVPSSLENGTICMVYE